MTFHEDLEHRVGLTGPCHEASIRRDTNLYQSRRHWPGLLRHALERLGHEINPHWQCRASAFLTSAERTLLIESHPRRADERSIEAAEPDIASVVAGSCLACDIVTLQHARPRC